MRRFLPFIILAACNPAHQQRVDACNSLQLSLSKPEAFKQQCVQDDMVYADAYEENLYKSDPLVLCSIDLNAPNTPSATLSKKIASERKINCKPLQERQAKAVVAELDVSLLCHSWATNYGNNIFRKHTQNEVKNRGANCSQIIAAENQAQAARMQAAAQQAQAAAAWQSTFNASRSRTTNCYDNGFGVTCNSY